MNDDERKPELPYRMEIVADSDEDVHDERYSVVK